MSERKSIMVPEEVHEELSVLKYRNGFTSFHEMFADRLIDDKNNFGD
jgi:predicted CopG family antitoxin